jgi:hypothetical protein
MGAEDGDAGGDQVQQDSPDGAIGGQPFRCGKRHRMMRDDQFDARLDGFRRAGRRNRQAGHQFRDALLAIADQQSDVVPVFGQAEGGELFEERGDLTYGGHDFLSRIVQGELCVLAHVQHSV